MFSVETFKQFVEDEVFRYLAVGDQVYTKDGLSLDDMFRRFDDNYEKLLIDFLQWSLTKRKQ